MKKEKRINEILKNMYYPNDNIYHIEPTLPDRVIQSIKSIFKRIGKFFTRRRHGNVHDVHREECGVMNRPWVD